jgi:gluconate 2-dehydrogenase gamma chain
MLDAFPSRRHFLQLSGAGAVGAWMALGLTGCREAAESAAEAMKTGEGPRVLEDGERRTLESFSDRILPAEGDQPGAVAMGAVVFMDHFLAERPDQLQAAREAVKTLDARAREAHADAAGFAALAPDAQDALLDALKESDPQVVFPLWTLVMFGVFSDPSHGGNRDKAGWAMIGFDDRHAWQPPFGYYDAQVAQGGDA